MAMKKRKFGFRANRCVDGDGCPNNGTRAEWAEAGVHGFLDATGEPDTELALTDSIGDLIADLLHLCDRIDVDATAVLAAARHNWECER